MDDKTLIKQLATEVMGWIKNPNNIWCEDDGKTMSPTRPYFNPLENLADAFMLVDKISKEYSVELLNGRTPEWRCRINKKTEYDYINEYSETAPRAISMAIAKAYAIDI